eukprot:jgi/Psemu1/306824/fgenesh1_kg.284_\
MFSYTTVAALLALVWLSEDDSSVEDNSSDGCSHKTEKPPVPSIITINMPPAGGRKSGVSYPGRDAESIRNKDNRLHRKTQATTQSTQGTQDNQLVPLMLGQPTQPTQLDEASELTPASTADNKSKMMEMIAAVLKEGREDRKLHQQALQLQQRQQELQQRRQDRADEEMKVLLQALVAHFTSGGGGTRPPITPQVTTPQVTTAEGKLKRKVNSLHHCNGDYSSDDNDDSFRSGGPRFMLQNKQTNKKKRRMHDK